MCVTGVNWKVKFLSACNDKASFKTRPCFGRILPLEFNLKEIFNEVNNCNISEEDWSYNSHRSAILVDIKYRLTYLIGYYAHHYISFVRDGEKWYRWEDSATSLLGDSTALFDHLEKHKIIPYLVFYQKWGDEDEQIKSSDSHNIKSQQITIQFNERDIKNKNISSAESLTFNQNTIRNSKTKIEKQLETIIETSTDDNNNKHTDNNELGKTNRSNIFILPSQLHIK